MADVFISYRRSDRERILRVVELFEKLNVSVWFDAKLEAGDQFDDEISRELGEAKAQLICWSPDSVRSRWVRSEAHIGVDRGIHVPVMIAPCKLPPPFNLDHTIDLSDWDGSPTNEGWQFVLSRVGSLLGRGASLARWTEVSTSMDPVRIRAFLREFGNDPLTAQAKHHLFSCELQILTRRLEIELDLPTAPDLISENARLHDELSAQRRALAEREASHQHETDQLGRNLRQAEAHIRSLNARIAGTEEDLTSIRHQLETSNRALAERTDHAANLSESLEAARLHLARLDAERSQLGEQLRLTATSSELHLRRAKELEELTLSMERQKAALQGQSDSLASQLKDSSHTVSELEALLQVERLKNSTESAKVPDNTAPPSMSKKFGATGSPVSTLETLLQAKKMPIAVLTGAAAVAALALVVPVRVPKVPSASSLTSVPQASVEPSTQSHPSGEDRCKGSYEIEKCLALERKLAAETPEATAARRASLEAERTKNIGAVNAQAKKN